MVFAQSHQPNIVLFFSDDHTQQSVSAYHDIRPLYSDFSGFDTPNIDRIARQGVRFTQSFVGNSICGPSRATLLTGLHSHGHGFRRNNVTFDGSQQTLPKILQANGYDTALIGKWHLRSEPTGFHYYERLVGQGNYYKPVLRTANGQGGTTDVTYTGEYVADVITDRTIDWFKNSRDPSKPFFLMVNHKGTHRNWMPPPESFASPTAFNSLENEQAPFPPTLFDRSPGAANQPNDYPTRADGASQQRLSIADHLKLGFDVKLGNPGSEYDRMTPAQRVAFDAAMADIRLQWSPETMTEDEKTQFLYQRYVKDYARSAQAIDQSVGKVLDYLEQNQLDRNTIIIYASDQGFYLGEHGWYDKRWMYEQSLTTPLLMQWKDENGNSKLDAASDVDAFVQNIDYAPTLLDAAGIDDFPPMHGQSFLGLATSNPEDNPAQWRESIYYRYYEGGGTHNVARHYGVRTETYKLIYYHDLGQWELFDLQADPHEVNNLLDGIDPQRGIPRNPALETVVVDLMTKLHTLREQYQDFEGPDFTIPGVDPVRPQVIALRPDDARSGYTANTVLLTDNPVHNQPPPGDNDGQWGFAADPSNGQSQLGLDTEETARLFDYVWVSRADQGEDNPQLTTVVSGLAANQEYELYLYQVTHDTQDWGLEASIQGITSPRSFTADTGEIFESRSNLRLERVLLGIVSGVSEASIAVDDLNNRGFYKGIGIASLGLLGDYNDNGVVDTADYTLWRNSLGKSSGQLRADGNHDGIVDQLDYDIWKSNFGAVLPESTHRPASTVPEPTQPATSLGILWLGLLRSTRR